MAVGVVLHLFQWKKKKPKRSLTQIMALIRSGQTFKMGGHVFNEQPGGKRTPNEDGDAEEMCGTLLRHMYGTRAAADGW